MAKMAEFAVGQRVRYPGISDGPYKIIALEGYTQQVDNGQYAVRRLALLLEKYGRERLDEWPYERRIDAWTDHEGWIIVENEGGQ